MNVSSFEDLPTTYLGQGIVFATREAAEAAAALHPEHRITEGDEAWVLWLALTDDGIVRAEAAAWETVGELVTDPAGVLPPVWLPE